MIAYSLTSISCIFELFYFLTSAPFQLIRVSISDFGRPFKLLIQSFNPYCSADYLLRGIATLSVLLHVYVVTCLDVYLAIDWLILECTDGKQRNEISSLFNALLLWDISISSTILRASIPPDMRMVQQKSGLKNEKKKKNEQRKHGVKKKERKRPSVVGDSGWAAGNTISVSVLDGRDLWGHSYGTGVY